MLKIFQRLFPAWGGIPSTAVYEKNLFELERTYAHFMEIKESEEFKRYLSLKQYVSSPEYKNDLRRVKSLSFNNSHEGRVEKQYDSIQKLKDVKYYIQTGEGESSVNVQEYIRLRNEIESHEFVKQKQFLKNRKRHKESEPYLDKLEYDQLKKSDMVKTYYKLDKKYMKQFVGVDEWVSKLYDDFSKNDIDESRWLTKPYWGEVLLNGGSYSQNDEMQLTTEGKNLKVKNENLSIITQKEFAKGLAWNSKMGFVPKAFNYTSGIISTAASFRQLYGRFEAKVRVDKTANVYHAFWMAADTKFPHLNIFKFVGDKLIFAAYNEDNGVLHVKEEVCKFKLDNGFYIYTLLWDEQKISWLINGKEVCKCPNFINEPMYIAFSTGVNGEIPDHQLPVELEVDWVRCFRKN